MTLPVPTWGGRRRASCVFGNPTANSINALVYCMVDPLATSLQVTINEVVYTAVLAAPGANQFLMTQFGHCWTGKLEVSGLSEFTTYDWQLQQGSDVDSGRFTTSPGMRDDFTIWEVTCDNNTTLTNNGINPNPETTVGMWGHIQADAESDDTPKTIGIFHVDDHGYVDSMLVEDNIDGTATGLTQTTRIQDLCNENDASLPWLANLGALGGDSQQILDGDNELINAHRMSHWGREESRAWCKRNLLLFPAVGDHEYQNDTGTRLVDVTTGGNARWSNYATKTAGIGQIAWDAFYGHLMPPTANGGTNDPDANHWFLEIGSLALVSIEPHSHGTGGEASYVPVNPSDPTSFVQKTVQLGTNQIDDVLVEMKSSVAAFKVIGLSVGFRYLNDGSASTFSNMAQHPLFNWQNTEFKRLFTDTATSLMSHKNTNGASGCTILLGGDLHRANVQAHRSFAYTGNYEESFDHWHAGTVNGSINFNNATGVIAGQWYLSADGITRTKLLYDSDWSNPNHQFAAVRTEVYGSEKPRRMVKSLVNEHGVDIFKLQYFEGGGNRGYEIDKKSAMQTVYSEADINFS